MNKVLRISVLCFCIIMFANCASNEVANSDAVKQSEIYQEYSIAYNSGEKELTATAAFRFGGANGTTLILVKPSKVLFEKQEMSNETSVFSGSFYEMNIQADLKAVYTYIYTDGDGKSYSNCALIIPAEINKYPEIADKNIGFSVEWTYPLQDGEIINLFIEDKLSNSAFVFNNALGSTSMKMNPEELKNINPGEVNIYLVRENKMSIEKGTHLGGHINAKYTSKKIKIQLVGSEPLKDVEKDSIKG